MPLTRFIRTHHDHDTTGDELTMKMRVELRTRTNDHVAFIEPVLPFESVVGPYVVVWGTRLFTFHHSEGDMLVCKEITAVVVRETRDATDEASDAL